MRSVLEVDLSFRVRAEELLRRAPARPGAHVADLGCATGAFAARLASTGATVVCVDVAPENLAWVRRLHATIVEAGRVTPVEADVTALPLPDGSFDAVYCMEVLEHVDDDGAAASEIARVLRPGGVCAVTVPNSDAPPPLLARLGLASVHDHDGAERHVREGYSARELGDLLRSAGLESISITAIGGRSYRLLAGLVSLAHLVVRRVRGSTTWTWGDVEAAATTPALRLYSLVFPLLLPLARIGVRTPRGATLVAIARRPV